MLFHCSNKGAKDKKKFDVGMITEKEPALSVLVRPGEKSAYLPLSRSFFKLMREIHEGMRVIPPAQVFARSWP